LSALISHPPSILNIHPVSLHFASGELYYYSAIGIIVPTLSEPQERIRPSLSLSTYPIKGETWVSFINVIETKKGELKTNYII